MSDNSNKNRRVTPRDSRIDSGSVDLETPQSLSPKSPLEAMLNSLTQSTGSLSLTHSSTGSLPRSRNCDSPRKPIPQPRTKHLQQHPPAPPHHQHFPSNSSLDRHPAAPHSLSHSADSLNSGGDHSHHSREETVERMLGDAPSTHEYSEIYTPSKEWPGDTNGEKPPTPPLHRFPSWESRIYQVKTSVCHFITKYLSLCFIVFLILGPYITITEFSWCYLLFFGVNPWCFISGLWPLFNILTLPPTSNILPPFIDLSL